MPSVLCECGRPREPRRSCETCAAIGGGRIALVDRPVWEALVGLAPLELEAVAGLVGRGVTRTREALHRLERRGAVTSALGAGCDGTGKLWRTRTSVVLEYLLPPPAPMPSLGQLVFGVGYAAYCRCVAVDRMIVRSLDGRCIAWVCRRCLSRVPNGSVARPALVLSVVRGQQMGFLLWSSQEQEQPPVRAAGRSRRRASWS